MTVVSSTDPMRPEGELLRQHESWAERHARLVNAPPPLAKPARPRPVSPFVREARERRKMLRAMFDRQMFRPVEPELPHVDRGWPPYRPVAPYDDCSPSTMKRAPITMREIIRQVADKHRIPVNELVSHRRHTPVVVARQEAMWRCKMETTFSLPQIGRALGGRDHTTVLHGIKKHEQRMKGAANG